LALEVAVEVLVGADSLKIHETHSVIAGVTQQIELAQTADLVNPQFGEIAFFLLTDIAQFGVTQFGVRSCIIASSVCNSSGLRSCNTASPDGCALTPQHRRATCRTPGRLQAVRRS
jgi:hypothetical protein